MNNGMTSSNTTNGVPATSTKPVPYQKPVPPPTLPKTYQPSNAAAYRLASLERLTANRQRMLDQQLNSSLAAANGVTESPVIMIYLFRLVFVRCLVSFSMSNVSIRRYLCGWAICGDDSITKWLVSSSELEVFTVIVTFLGNSSCQMFGGKINVAGIGNGFQIYVWFFSSYSLVLLRNKGVRISWIFSSHYSSKC